MHFIPDHETLAGNEPGVSYARNRKEAFNCALCDNYPAIDVVKVDGGYLAFEDKNRANEWRKIRIRKIQNSIP